MTEGAQSPLYQPDPNLREAQANVLGISSLPSDLGEIVGRMRKALQEAASRKKSERLSLPTGRCVRAVPPPLFVWREPDNRLIGGRRKGSSSAETQTPRGMSRADPGQAAVFRLIASVVTLGRIWGHSVIGAQYCRAFKQPDVCPISPEHPRRLGYVPGRIRYPVQGRFHRRIYRSEFSG